MYKMKFDFKFIYNSMFKSTSQPVLYSRSSLAPTIGRSLDNAPGELAYSAASIALTLASTYNWTLDKSIQWLI